MTLQTVMTDLLLRTAGVKSTESNLTLEAIREKTAKLSSEVRILNTG